MSTVNKYNYEAVLLDFAEGRLSAKETSDLFDFLAAHPELQEDFDAALEMAEIQEDTEFSFSRKNSLLKDESQDSVQDIIIACVEGVASIEESSQLDKLVLSSTDVNKELEIFSKLKMEADESLVFSRKETLIKPVIRFSTWMYRATYAAAAVILLFIAFSGLYKNEESMAKTETPKNISDTQKPKDNVSSTKDEIQNLADIASNMKQGDDVEKLTQPKKIYKQNTVDSFSELAGINDDSPVNNSLEISPMEILEANSLNPKLKYALASFSETESEEDITKHKTASFIDMLSEESSFVANTYSFAGGLSSKVLSFADYFRQYNEVELNVFGLRTTIHKPSWMKWRRQKVKSE